MRAPCGHSDRGRISCRPHPDWGLYRSHSLQAVAVSGPAWLPGGAPGVMRHITVSSSPLVVDEESVAGALVQGSMAGTNTCFHLFPEALTLYGRLGVTTSEHHILYSLQVRTARLFCWLTIICWLPVRTFDANSFGR